MHYFVDGYNLLFRSMEAEDQLQKQRENLIKELTHRFEFINLNVTIVFDAAFSPEATQRSGCKLVEIVYTAAGESADSYIIEELKSMPQVRQETVVTSDKGLAWQVRRLGSDTVGVETFLTWLDSRYRNKMRKLHRKPKELPAKPAMRVKVPPPNKEEPPGRDKSPEQCLFFYEATFAKRYQEALSEEPKRRAQLKAEANVKRERKKPPKSDGSDLPSESEEERWLRLFTKELGP